jgi:hypothetical protein
MKIIVKTPRNPLFTGRRYIVDQDVYFQNGKAELEGDERHVATLKSYRYEVEVVEEKKKEAPKKNDNKKK